MDRVELRGTRPKTHPFPHSDNKNPKTMTLSTGENSCSLWAKPRANGSEAGAESHFDFLENGR